MLARARRTATLIAASLVLGQSNGHGDHKHHHHDHAQPLENKPLEEGVHLVELEKGFKHECIHDKIVADQRKNQKEGWPLIAKVNQSYPSQHPSRRGQPKAMDKIRVKWFWGEEGCITSSGAASKNCYCSSTSESVPNFQGANVGCSTDRLVGGTDLKDYIGDVMDAAAAWIEQVFSVERVTGTLKTGNMIVSGFAQPANTPYCGGSSWLDKGILTPASHHTTGVSNADFIVYVSATPVVDGSGTPTSTAAWALTCMSDQVDRPTHAHVNFNPVPNSNRVTRASPGSTEFNNFVATAVHEIFHAMGFSSGNWGGQQYWFEAHCTAKGQTNCAPTFQTTERGGTVTKMDTPEVLTKIREFSGCNTLNGAEIENEGGSGTAGSHWEKRVFGNEAMTGISGSHEAEWSPMTLAYFKDTGHYDVDYSMASADFTWGKSKGCSFWMDKCNEITPASAAAPEYCWPSNPTQDLTGCDYTLTSTGRCDVNQYGSCLPSQYQYFSQGCQYGGTQSGLTDFCPTIKGYSNTQCTDPNDAATGGIDEAAKGQSRASNSRCFESDIVLKSNMYTTSSGGGQRCFAVECAPDCLSYTIKLSNGDDVTCTGAGTPSSLPDDFSTKWRAINNRNTAGYITCWPVSDMCGDGARAKLGATCGGQPPSASPSASPTVSPSASPSASPSKSPSASPSDSPSASPSKSPQGNPTKSPTAGPSASPQLNPTKSPSASPSKSPTQSPSVSPSASPSTGPSKSPQQNPTKSPSASPSGSPTQSPSASPSKSPQMSPSSSPSASPSKSPQPAPTKAPIPPAVPTTSPQVPTTSPSASPSTSPTLSPSASPSTSPSKAPSKSPQLGPTESPSASPSQSPSQSPSASPSTTPSASPSKSPQPAPTKSPLTPASPTDSPLIPTVSPSAAPSKSPEKGPTKSPSTSPSASPSKSPQRGPTGSPSASPSKSPNQSPSSSPSASPSKSPSKSPQPAPTKSPLPASSPTESPQGPTVSPSVSPSKSPQKGPTTSPSMSPTGSPQKGPTASPSVSPSGAPTKSPLSAGSPTQSPVLPPTASPSVSPSPPPSKSPQSPPTGSPIANGAPSKSPALPSASPSGSPVKPPSRSPIAPPTSSPAPPTKSPVVAPTFTPVAPGGPTKAPAVPTVSPSLSPRPVPTFSPVALGDPTKAPVVPTTHPFHSVEPTVFPSGAPGPAPSTGPSQNPADECTSSPCGAGQTCVDPDTSVTGDFKCTCQSHVQGDGVATGQPAVCFRDECDDVPNPCGDQQYCRDPDLAVTDGQFQCYCVSPKKPERGTAVPSIGTPATCVTKPLFLIFRYLACKFRATWRFITGRMRQWTMKLHKTLLLPLQRRAGKPPFLRVTYVCPLDEKGLKPKPGSALAQQCFAPVKLGFYSGRAAEPLSETVEEFQALQNTNQGVFVEFHVGHETTDSADASVKSEIDDLILGKVGQGVMRNELNPSRVDPLLIIDPIDFAGTTSPYQDLTPIHPTECTTTGCDAIDGGHSAPAVSSWEEVEEDDSSFPLWAIITAAGGTAACILIVGGFLMHRRRRRRRPKFKQFAEEARLADKETAYVEAQEQEMDRAPSGWGTPQASWAPSLGPGTGAVDERRGSGSGLATASLLAPGPSSGRHASAPPAMSTGSTGQTIISVNMIPKSPGGTMKDAGGVSPGGTFNDRLLGAESAGRKVRQGSNVPPRSRQSPRSSRLGSPLVLAPPSPRPGESPSVSPRIESPRGPSNERVTFSSAQPPPDAVGSSFAGQKEETGATPRAASDRPTITKEDLCQI